MSGGLCSVLHVPHLSVGTKGCQGTLCSRWWQKSKTQAETQALFKSLLWPISLWPIGHRVRVEGIAKSHGQCHGHGKGWRARPWMCHSAPPGFNWSVHLSLAGNQRVRSFYLKRATLETGTYRCELSYNLLEKFIQRPYGIWWKTPGVSAVVFSLDSFLKTYCFLHCIYYI